MPVALASSPERSVVTDFKHSDSYFTLLTAVGVSAHFSFNSSYSSSVVICWAVR